MNTPLPAAFRRRSASQSSLDRRITVGEAARLLMLTARRVQQLASEGAIAKPYTVAGVVQGYLRSLEAAHERAGVKASRKDAEQCVRTLRLCERLVRRSEAAVATVADMLSSPRR